MFIDDNNNKDLKLIIDNKISEELELRCKVRMNYPTVYSKASYSLGYSKINSRAN